MENFKFTLGQQVIISCSSERGEVIGRAQYKAGYNAYLLMYKAADGRAVQDWWGEDTIQAVEEVDA